MKRWAKLVHINCCRLRRLKGSTDDGKLGGAACVRQEAEVANAAEAFWQHVEQEATHELVGFELHHLGLVVGAIILPAEANVAVLAGDEPAVGDCDPMGVTAEIFQHLLRPAEGPLCIDVPFDVAQHAEVLGEDRRLREMGEIAEEHQLRFVEGGLQSLQKQPPIESRQNPDGEEEVRLAADPSSVGSKAASRDDTVSVRMMAPTPTIP
jgi:hypothetical protein